MSRLTDLIARARAKDAALGDELEREFKALSARKSFGLNFERHKPETVELPGRPVRKGDKVRVLPKRGTLQKGDPTLWKVLTISKVDDVKFAEVAELNVEEPTIKEVAVADLVVVAEFRDYIYPGLKSTGKVEEGGDRPYHSVINGENFHVLEALTYTHRGKVDAIYIDPPYNTGAKDWKYNNDYVESEDLYRHSKWLAFIERRLRIAKELLNPSRSVLIITIDEKEYLRLGLLLEQVFPEAAIEMVTSVISAKGVARAGQFSRVEEFIFFVKVGDSFVELGEQNMLDDSRSASSEIGKNVNWLGLRRREPTAKRGARPNQFYPIFVNIETGYIHSIGDPISDDIDRNEVKVPEGCFAVWPLRPNGDEGLWGITPETSRKYHEQGFIRSRNHKPEKGTSSINYLPSGTVKAIFEGRIEVVGHDPDGAVQAVHKEAKGVIPKRVWNMPSHNAESGGSVLLSKIIPNRRFPFPKSIYAVEDALRFFIGKNPQAIVLDFFSGSGTTAHAVMRLNKQDGGRRISISVTNNEVAADEQSNLRKAKLRPGDPEWEKWGICDYITKPRIKAVITGKTPDGGDIEGDYKFSDCFPMADGFQENAEFFTLTYETPVSVRHNVSFERIAPLLWMRAGSQGSRIEKIPAQGWDVVETYGVLVSLDQANLFCEAVQLNPEIRVAFIVTDDDRRFQAVTRHLPASVESVRLYESYLSNFRFSMGR
ncbi:site-specific DNA-methyltransferase [Marinobacter sp. F3R08]|uniref:site-specific DNA-methyltransferase n=1 Tax=Marinobacter sp. F3R08 TaxID=2841559 RepID=UPI001C0A12A2|nr:DNA methyltransferase [Marinobacter sp. F3R08]MBU2955828.1 site-specific DNA-methyltransferase [Marinobacter sp. F3R08]